MALVDDDFWLSLRCDQDANQLVSGAKQYFDKDDPEDQELLHLNRYFGALGSILNLYKEIASGMLGLKKEEIIPALTVNMTQYWTVLRENEKYIQGPKLTKEQLDSYRKESGSRLGTGDHAYVLEVDKLTRGNDN